ncbi:MAG: STM3941 family protein [Mucilaginibacter sp.]
MKTEFRFSPLWVLFITVMVALFDYKSISYYTAPLVNAVNAVDTALVLIVSYLLLPMTFKLIFNIPAIVLTDDCLRNNFGGYSIQWEDIADIKFSDSGMRSFATLIINLKDPEKYFASPVKKAIYKIKQLFSPNDILIRIDFVAGDNGQIFETVKAYWTKHFESKHLA